MNEVCSVFFVVALICLFDNVCHSNNMASRRIEGGGIPVNTHFKFMAQLEIFPPKYLQPYYAGVICAGTIIHWEWVLTAAHCIYLLPARNQSVHRDLIVYYWYVKIKAGSQYVGFGKDVLSQEIYLHENYPGFEGFDIALILTVPMLFTSDVSHSPIGAVELNTETFDIEDKRLVARVFGWGVKLLTAQPFTLNGLEYLLVNIYPWTLCLRYAGLDLSKREFCTAPKAYRKAPCYGDSGGPLLRYGKQIGVVSHLAIGNVCGIVPQVHTNVATFQDWIMAILGFNLTSWRIHTKNGTDYTLCGERCKHFFTVHEFEVSPEDAVDPYSND